MVSETWLCASPDYLAAHGTPVRAADLTGHSLIGYHDRSTIYQDEAGGDAGRIELPPAIAISDSAALLPVVLAGAGIAYLPDFLARPLVADGRLVRLRPTIAGEPIVIHAVYPGHHSLSTKVRVFIDALTASIARHDIGT